jgi:HEAT repeats
VVAATRVVVDRALLWAFAATWAVSALAALIAAVAAWRAARTARRVLTRIEALRATITSPARPPGASPAADTAPYRIEVHEGSSSEGPLAEPFVAGPGRRGPVPPPADPAPTPVPPPPPPQPARQGPAEPEPAEAPWFVQSERAAEHHPVPPPEEGPAAARRRRLDDPDPFVRIEAIVELRGQPDVIEALLRALQDEYPVVRRQAVRALRDSGGPQAIRALIEVANQDPSAEVREESVVALGSLLREARSDHG